MASTITNTDVDNAIAALPSMLGTPITRVTDVTTLPTPNSNIKLEFSTTNIGDGHVWITYEELLNFQIVERLLKQVAGVTYRVEKLKEGITVAYAYVSGLTAPHTQAELKEAVALLKQIGVDAEIGAVSTLGSYLY